MKLIKRGRMLNSLHQILNDHRLSWSDKGIYTELINQPNHSRIDLIELSTHATDGLAKFKAGLKHLREHHYLVINNKLLIINPINSQNQQISAKRGPSQIIQRHDREFTSKVLKNQWLIVWHHDDVQVVRALDRLAQYLNPEMVLYGIQCSKQHCRSYRESLPYLNQLIMKWKQHHLTNVGRTQRWMNDRKLKSKPWNSETQNRIFSSRHRKMLNNTPLNRGIPSVFKKHNR